MNDFFDLVVLALAANQIIEIWNHGSIMSTAKAYTQTFGDFASELLNCMFCLTPYVSVALLAMHYTTVGRFIASVFAIAKLANIINDVLHDKCRTPK